MNLKYINNLTFKMSIEICFSDDESDEKLANDNEIKSTCSYKNKYSSDLSNTNLFNITDNIKLVILREFITQIENKFRDSTSKHINRDDLIKLAIDSKIIDTSLPNWKELMNINFIKQSKSKICLMQTISKTRTINKDGCKALIGSGQYRGQVCGAKISSKSSTKNYCGRHLGKEANEVPGIIEALKVDL